MSAISPSAYRRRRQGRVDPFLRLEGIHEPGFLCEQWLCLDDPSVDRTAISAARAGGNTLDTQSQWAEMGAGAAPFILTSTSANLPKA